MSVGSHLRGVLCACLLHSPLCAREDLPLPIPPAPTQFVTDQVGLLQPATRQHLDTQLEEHSRSTGQQILVWLGSSLQGASLEEWTNQAFNRWRPGQKGLDNGAILFVFLQDRLMRIEVGYGLEPYLTDLTSSRILQEIVGPDLARGKPDEAITQGVAAMLQVVKGEPLPSSKGERWLFILFLFALALFVWMRRRWGPPGGGGPWIGPRGGFGGSGGSGGFRGGGGFGGGGGASGRF